MWVVIARAPQRYAPYWPGRRWLAAVDAVAWPGIAWAMCSQLPSSGGLVLRLAMAILILCAMRRFFTAVLANESYHFTTWRWGRSVFSLLATGFVLKWISAI